ncbi:unnamed protein product [Zymoseptoria tritici ST99CH_3D7]|uniref:Copper transport protein n=1 Tax=Zymoseptoria tritici (strain ST99CH_3D7) TaxID=1276538 RepID=A0A1X7S7I8_ZYMT9|nr:unnamed protein product [Zymoseptoria tritici ST99CH_3D7]
MKMVHSSSMNMNSGMESTDHSGHSMMSMANMIMTFFTSRSTPLYAESWTPNTTGQYVGTIIFLIVLAAIFRAIVVLRVNFDGLMAWYTYRRETSMLRKDFEGEDAGLRSNIQKGRPWNINIALARACLDTILAGTSYLLMLAVMTMNVGYFIAVLGGTFLGSFILGDWDPTGDHCDGH